MPDLPDISQDINVPLPGSPDPTMTPYRIGGPTGVTTGWGPRGPVAPPQGAGGGIQPPDMGDIYRKAFNTMPVDQAMKAIEMATRYQGQRGYQQDLNNGMTAAQAFAKWGPMLFHGTAGAGMSAAIRASQPQPEVRKLFDVGGSLVRAGSTGPAETLVPRPQEPPAAWMPANEQTGEPAHWQTPKGPIHVAPTPKPPSTKLTGEALVEDQNLAGQLKAEYANMNLFVNNPRKAKEVQDRISKLVEQRKALYKGTAANPPSQAPGQAQAQPSVVRDASGKFVYSNPAAPKPATAPATQAPSLGSRAVSALKAMSDAPGMDPASASVFALKNIPVKKLEASLGKSIESTLRELLPNELLKKLGLKETPVTGPMAGRATDETSSD